MKAKINFLTLALLLAGAASALAEVHYVDVNSTNATPPYTNWTNAATNIQDAVDAALAGDEIVVTNGIYGHVYVGSTLALRSVNGPQFTTIDGGGSVHCVYLTNSAILTGFTLTHGLAENGGGAYGGTLNNCTLTDNRAGFGGGAAACTLYNCTLTANRTFAPDGSGNFGGSGGGASDCTLYNCSLTDNQAGDYGGGAESCALNNCTLSSNSAIYHYSYFGAAYGGGAYQCTLNNCTLNGNLAENNCSGPRFDAPSYGGGACECILNDCVLTSNSATGCIDSRGFGGGVGGGADNCKLNNCTLTGNSATWSGGGAYYGTLNNCIEFGNYVQGSCEDCGWDPRFVDLAGGNLRLQPNSPCINAGNNSYGTNPTDLDGNPRISAGIVDIGAYEYQWPQLTIAPSGPNVVFTWPTDNSGYDYTGFTLQSTTNLVSPAVWSTNSPAPVVVNGQNAVTTPIAGTQQFYRLVQ